MFRIKICGITNVDDALAAARAGAQAVGLNFYAGSPRCVSTALAAEIAAALPVEVARVGVFVNPTFEELLETHARASLDFVQLHGDEPPQMLAELCSRGIHVLRAFRWGDEGLTAAREYLERCRQLAALPQAVLIDARAAAAYGGTGQTVDWNSLRPLAGKLADCPLLLAGGLTPENVAAAIATSRPYGVDTASGVESQPGKKDEEKVRRFITAALASLKARG